jgi:hypothetical protein
VFCDKVTGEHGIQIPESSSNLTPTKAYVGELMSILPLGNSIANREEQKCGSDYLQALVNADKRNILDCNTLSFTF